MCLYPQMIKNRKYMSTKKNGGHIPTCYDERVKYVPIACGHCMECAKKRANEWRIRLQEEYNYNSKVYFVTLTFDNENLDKLIAEIEKPESNAIATIAVRRFLERYRKKYGKSARHWLITELGHLNTQRIHLHGLIWTEAPQKELQQLWKYGLIGWGNYVNERTINYITKYVTKIDHDHEGYEPIILCSAGIGANYINRAGKIINKFKGYESETNEIYKFNNGVETSLPIYYRNKLYNDDIREYLWLKKLDKGERFVYGVKVKTDDLERIEKLLKAGQEMNERVGFKSKKDYKKKEYNARLIELKELKELKLQAHKLAKNEQDEKRIYNKLRAEKFKFLKKLSTK